MYNKFQKSKSSCSLLLKISAVDFFRHLGAHLVCSIYHLFVSYLIYHTNVVSYFF